MAGASVIGLIDPAKVAITEHTSWIALSHPAFLQLGFDTGLMPAFLAAGIAASLRAASSRPASALTTLSGDSPTELTSAKGCWPTGFSMWWAPSLGCLA
jgi:hypothetical protein